MTLQPGTLLTCDPTIKQLILHRNNSEHFIIADIDDTHLLIQPGERTESVIIKMVEDHHRSLTFVVEETKVKRA